jgi:hypothetical protein
LRRGISINLSRDKTSARKPGIGTARGLRAHTAWPSTAPDLTVLI